MTYIYKLMVHGSVDNFWKKKVFFIALLILINVVINNSFTNSKAFILLVFTKLQYKFFILCHQQLKILKSK